MDGQAVVGGCRLQAGRPVGIGWRVAGVRVADLVRDGDRKVRSCAVLNVPVVRTGGRPVLIRQLGAWSVRVGVPVRGAYDEDCGGAVAAAVGKSG